MKGIASTLCKLLSTSLAAMLLTSCATIFSGTRADIFIHGDVDEPVTIVSSQGEYKDVTLPTVVEVKRRHLNGQHIQISSEHHTFDDIVLRKAFNEWALASIILSGAGGVVIDLITNAVSKPHYDCFFVRPNDSIPSADTPRTTASTTFFLFGSDPTKTNLRSHTLPKKYPRHEVNATLGLGRNQADPSTKRFIDSNLTQYHLEDEFECFDLIGASYVVGKVEYHYRLNRKWDIGAMAGWGLSREDYSDEPNVLEQKRKEAEEQKTSPVFTYGYENCRTFSFAPSARYTWYETHSYRLFSRVAVGMMRHHRTFEVERWKYNAQNTHGIQVGDTEYMENTKWRMAYQLSPIGVTVGSDNLRFIAELGYGCLGVVNMGIAVCF